VSDLAHIGFVASSSVFSAPKLPVPAFLVHEFLLSRSHKRAILMLLRQCGHGTVAAAPEQEGKRRQPATIF
jgi:hypothetical protein